MMPTVLIALDILALVAIYMSRPRVREFRLSSVRFFHDLPAPRRSEPKLRLASPATSPPFFVQLAVLVALLLSLVAATHGCGAAHVVNGSGMWLVVDTSASMSTADGAGTRMDSARRAANAVLDEATAIAGAAPFCVRLSTFDLERRDLVAASDVVTVRAALAGLAPRALGTDVRLVRGIAAAVGDACPVGHVVVVSDLPPPAWVAEPSPVPIVWRGAGAPVPNVGITALTADRNPLTGRTTRIEAEGRAFGTTPVDVHYRVTDASGVTVADGSVTWNGDRWHVSWPAIPGRMRFELSPGGAYHFDDAAEIDVDAGARLRVDWRLPDPSLPRRLGWVPDAKTPDLRVVPAGWAVSDSRPTLLVARTAVQRAAEEIGSFEAESGLTADLNLDVLERIAPSRAPIPGFSGVITAADGRPWVAVRADPPSVLVPAPPTAEGGDTGRAVTVAFFNAVRWLVARSPARPLYELTSPAAPEPEGTRLALHDGEGDTSLTPSSSGRLDVASSPVAGGEVPPAWPRVVALAAFGLLVERMLAAHGGIRWR